MRAHTPGPWRLESESRGTLGSDTIITDAEGGWSIAECELVSIDGEAEANARLIATAPELLAVVKALHDKLLEFGSDGHATRCILFEDPGAHSPYLAAPCDCHIQKAYDALAKARGK